MKWLGNAAIIGGLIGAAIHFMRFGRKADPHGSAGSPRPELAEEREDGAPLA